jgi:hypothetical protein
VGLFRLRLELKQQDRQQQQRQYFFYCSSISKGIIFRRWWLLYESWNSTLDFYFIVFRYSLGFHQIIMTN